MPFSIFVSNHLFTLSIKYEYNEAEDGGVEDDAEQEEFGDEVDEVGRFLRLFSMIIVFTVLKEDGDGDSGEEDENSNTNGRRSRPVSGCCIFTLITGSGIDHVFSQKRRGRKTGRKERTERIKAAVGEKRAPQIQELSPIPTPLTNRLVILVLPKGRQIPLDRTLSPEVDRMLEYYYHTIQLPKEDFDWFSKLTPRYIYNSPRRTDNPGRKRAGIWEGVSVLPLLFLHSLITNVRKLWLLIHAKRLSSSLGVRLDVVTHEDFMKMIDAETPSATSFFASLAEADLVLGGLVGSVLFFHLSLCQADVCFTYKLRELRLDAREDAEGHHDTRLSRGVGSHLPLARRVLQVQGVFLCRSRTRQRCRVVASNPAAPEVVN